MCGCLKLSGEDASCIQVKTKKIKHVGTHKQTSREPGGKIDRRMYTETGEKVNR